jgi:hypothetical protein
MNIYEFYAALKAKCMRDIGKCPECGAREFCFTAPLGMTDEIIRQAVALVESDATQRTSTAAQTRSDHCSEA